MIRKYWYKFFTTLLWSFLTIMTIIPIYWMFLVSTKKPVDLFAKPNLFPTFFKDISPGFCQRRYKKFVRKPFYIFTITIY